MRFRGVTTVVFFGVSRSCVVITVFNPLTGAVSEAVMNHGRIAKDGPIVSINRSREWSCESPSYVPRLCTVIHYTPW
jgi:hypothetical protein